MRRTMLIVLSLCLVAAGLQTTVAPRAAGAARVVSAPLPPGRVSVPDAQKSVPKAVPPTQQPGAVNPLSKKISAQLAARGRPLPVAAGPAPQPQLAAGARELASLRARHLLGPQGTLGGHSVKVPARVPTEAPGATGPKLVPPPDNAVGPLRAFRAAGTPKTAAVAGNYASYSVTNSWVVNPTYSNQGAQWVGVTNTGTTVWLPDTITMGYHLTNLSGGLNDFLGQSTLITTTVLPGQTVDVLATMEELGAGSYEVVWDLETVDAGYWSQLYGVPASQAVAFTVPHYAPSAIFEGPADGATVDSTSPMLEIVVEADGTVQNFADFDVCTDTTATMCWDSGWLLVQWYPPGFDAIQTWSPLARTLSWNTNYVWRMRVEDSTFVTPYSAWSSFTPVLPPPPNAQVGSGGTADGAGVELFLGSYQRDDKDISFQVPNYTLSLDRYYDSDNTASGVFGVGWSSVLDMRRTVDAAGDVTVTFPDGRQVSYGQDPNGRYVPGMDETSEAVVVNQNDVVMQGGVSYQFDPTTGLLSQIVPYGSTGFPIVVNRDPLRRVISLTWSSPFGASTRAMTVNYGSLFSGLVNSVTETGLATSWNYTYTGGELTRVCDPRTDLSACRGYSYPNGRMATTTSPDGYTTTVGYNADGTVATVTEPLSGASDTWSYVRHAPEDLGASFVEQVTDPQGTNVYYEFDSLGRLWARWLNSLVPGAGVPVRSWVYGLTGQVSAMRDENGNEIEYLWGDDGLLVETITARDALHLVYTHYTYDTAENGQILSPADPRFEQLTSQTDPNGKPTVLTYTPNGEVATSRTPPTRAAPAGAPTTYTYTCDPLVGDPLVVNDPGAPVNARQPCGLLHTVTDDTGQVTQYGYDRNGDQSMVTTPTGEVTTSLYDSSGKLMSRTVTDPSGTSGTTTYTYDFDGRLLTETDPAVLNPVTGIIHQKQTINTYDADGNLIETVERDTNPSAGADAPRTTQYSYDAMDNQTQTMVNGTITQQTTYNALGNIRATGLLNGNGPDYLYVYDTTGNLTNIFLTNFVDYSTGTPTRRRVLIASYAYDASGRVAASIDAMGKEVTYGYTLDDLLATETLQGYQATPTSTAGPLLLHAYTYDLAGNLLTDATGNGTRTITNTYDGDNSRISTTVDPGSLNRTTSYTYDTAGQILTTTLSNGTGLGTATTTNVYGPGEQLTQTSVHNDATPDIVTDYVRDGMGRVTESIDPRGTLPLGTIPAPDPTYDTNNTYDALGRLVQTTGPTQQVDTGVAGAATGSGRPTVTRGYDTFGDLTDEVDANGNHTQFHYDAMGRQTEIDYPVANQPNSTTSAPKETWTYDVFGNVLTHTDQLGQTTSYAYDLRNRPYQITSPPATAGGVAGVTTLAWDDDGNLLSQIDPTGAQTLYTYDSAGRMATKVLVVRNGTATPTQDTTTYLYDVFGEPTSVSTADTTIQYTYDNVGEVSAETESGRGTTVIVHDLAGRVVRVQDPLRRSVVTVYDLAGRPVQTIQSGGGTVVAKTTTTNDAAGNPLQVTDPDGHVWSAQYNMNNQVVQLTDPATTDPSGTQHPGAVVHVGYDLNGNQTKVTDADGNSTYTSYDALNEPVTVTEPATAADPSDRTWTTSYNTAGEPVAATQPGGVTVASTYDNVGELVTQSGTGAAAPDVTKQFGYDLDGRTTSISSPVSLLAGTSGTETFGYDDRGLVTSTTAPAPAGLPTTTYTATYDSDGRLTQQTDPSGTENYTYSGVDDLASVSADGTTHAYTYDAAGQLTTEADSTGGTPGPSYSYAYDNAGNPSGETAFDATGTSTGSLNYTFDPVGNITATAGTGVFAGQGDHDYTYDQANRLLSDTTLTSGVAGSTQSYTWDPEGNRTAVTTTAAGAAPSVTTTAFDQRNEPISQSGPTGTTTLAWSPRGTLASQTTTPNGGTPSTTITTFDAFNRLYVDSNPQSVVNGNQHSVIIAKLPFLYDAADRLASGGQGPVRYAPGALEPSTNGQSAFARTPDGTALAVAPAAGGAAQGLLTNLHGDTIATTNPSSGAVTGTFGYDAFGVPTAGGSAPAIGYQGSYTSPATQLVYAQSRWYDPSIDSFLSQDSAPGPAGDAADTNLYAYGSANPISNLDPTGHFSVPGFSTVVHDAKDALNALENLGKSAVNAAKGAGEEVFGGIEDAGAFLESAGVTIAEDAGASITILGGGEIVAGAIIVVVVGALVYEYVVNSNGSVSAISGGTSNPHPATGGGPQYLVIPADTGTAPTAHAPAKSTAAKPAPAKGSKTPAAPQISPPPAKQQVYITGTSTVTSTSSWTTTSSWFDDTYRYTRTDSYTDTSTTTTTYYSDGASSWRTTTSSSDAWHITAQQLIDWSDPVVLPTPEAGPAVAPGPNSNVATAAQPCGGGGTVATCLQATDPPLPPGGAYANDVGPARQPGDIGQPGALPPAQAQLAGANCVGGLARPDGTSSALICEGGNDTGSDVGAGCTTGGNSFTPDTQVLLASGKLTPISSLEPGDTILATNTETGRTSPEKIDAVEVNHDTDLYDLTIKTGHGATVIHTTSSHLFWDPTAHTWVKAAGLRNGEHLRTADGQPAVAAGGHTPANHDGWMWDLTISGDNDHDFYVVAGDASRTADSNTATVLAPHDRTTVVTHNSTIDNLHTYRAVADDTPVLVHNASLICSSMHWYGPTNPGPLSDDDAKTFRSATYRELTLAQPTTLYRVYGNRVGQLSGWWSRVKPTGPSQAIIDSALDQVWGNSATNWVSIRVPAGTTFYEGIPAEQRGLVGGGSQVFFTSRVSSSWINGGGRF